MSRRKKSKKKTIDEAVMETVEETTKESEESEKKVEDVLETSEASEVVDNSKSEDQSEIDENDEAVSEDKSETEDQAEAEDQTELEEKSESKDQTETEEEPETEEQAEAKEDSESKEDSETGEQTESEDLSKSEEQPETKTDSTEDSQAEHVAEIGVDDAYVDKTLVEKAAKKAQKKEKIKKFFKVSVICLLSTAAAAYLIIAVWFMFHYNRNTYINDMDMSYHSTAEMRNIINSYIENYRLTIYLRGDDTHLVDPSDINLQIEPLFDEMDVKHDQNALLWPLYMSNEKRYNITYTVTYDESLLDQYLSTFECLQEENMIPAENAHVIVENGESVIVEETKGTIIDYDALKEEIYSALDSYALEIDLNDSPCYVEADITSESEEIAVIKEELDHYLDMVISYQIDDVSWELDASTFGDWLYYNNKKWHFNSNNVADYVEDLADKYDTVGTVRKFKTYNGTTVEQLGPRYGWMIDQEAEAEALLTDLQAGKSTDRTPLFLQEGAAYNDDNDIGDTYIEVDLTNQHVYLTVDGKMIYDTACVTGKVTNGNATPPGLYSITYKQSPAVLRGADYETPVSYWMPFNYGVGLHDATWRGSFGGNIYYAGGSHGCVNLPYSAAQFIYSYAYAGMPVICYY